MDPLDPASILAQEEIARQSIEMYSILTALNNNMPEMAVDVITDIMMLGANNVAEFIFVMAGGAMGLVEGVCELTGTTSDDFLAKAAQRSAENLAAIAELRRDGHI